MVNLGRVNMWYMVIVLAMQFSPFVAFSYIQKTKTHENKERRKKENIKLYEFM